MNKTFEQKTSNSDINKVNSFAQNISLNSSNPATKLLEKRRLMYDVQEAFEQEKGNFKRF